MTDTTAAADGAPPNKHTDNLRENADDISETLHQLADEIDAGDAEPEAVAEAFREVAASLVSVEDAAEHFIDCDADRWRAIDELRKAMYYASADATVEGGAPEPALPELTGIRTEAVVSATAAAEHLERDDE